MPLPEDVSTCLVTGSYVGFDGEPALGEVHFYPTVSELRSASGVTILRSTEPLVAVLVNGELSISVPATDDPDLTPTGWGYKVVERFVNRTNDPVYSILAPAVGVDLPTALPAAPVSALAPFVRTINNEAPNSAGNVSLSASDVGAAPTAHTHAVADVTGLQAALDGKQAAGDYATNGALTTGLAGKANTAHTHAIADTTGLQAALDAKQPAGSYATSTDLTNGLATKVAKGDLVYNVKDYGATGNGATDDSAAIRSAIAAAVAAGGGRVYFPAGTFLVSIGTNEVALHVTGQRVTLEGASRGASVIKLANSQGDYKAIVGDNTTNGTTDLTGLTVRNLTFNQNSTGNVISNITNLMGGHPRYVIRAFVGRRILVENCRFTDANNVNTVSFNGGSVVGEVTIRGNVFDDHGANSPDHDHSAIYTNCDSALVVDNVFVGIAVSARTAIEVHGPRQVVTGNIVRDFFVGVNLAGVSPLASNGCVVNDNTMEGVGVGVCLWSRTSGANTTNGLRDSVVKGNSIVIDMDKWAAIVAFKSGILLDPGANLPIKNVLIDSNVIRYKTFSTVPTATDKSSNGVTWLRNDGAITASLQDELVVISNNQVQGAPGSGMLIHAKCVAAGFHIRDNVIVDPATGNSPNFATEYKCGIMIQGISGTTQYKDLQMIRNTVADWRATTVAAFGVHTAFVTGDHPGPVHQTHVFAAGTSFPAISTNNDLGNTAFVAY